MSKKRGKHAKAAAAIAPLNFLLPSVAVAACIAGTVLSYEPLVFDAASFAKPSQAQAAPLASIDTSEVERASAEPSTNASYSAADYGMDTTGLKDGTYTGSAYGFKSTITVQVTVADGKIASIVILSHGDDEEYFVRAKNVMAAVLTQQTTAVDTVSGATYSSEGILMAIRNALVNALASDADGSLIGSSPNNGESEGEEGPSAPLLPGTSEGGLEAGTKYLDGEYTACAACANTADPLAFEPYYLMLTVVIEDGEVADIKDVIGSETGLSEDDEPFGAYDITNDDYLDRVLYGFSRRGVEYKGLLEQLLTDRVELGELTAVTSATYSSQSFALAYQKALEAAALAYREAHPEEFPRDDTGAEDGANGEGGSADADADMGADAGDAPAEGESPNEGGAGEASPGEGELGAGEASTAKGAAAAMRKGGRHA